MIIYLRVFSIICNDFFNCISKFDTLSQMSAPFIRNSLVLYLNGVNPDLTYNLLALKNKISFHYKSYAIKTIKRN